MEKINAEYNGLLEITTSEVGRGVATTSPRSTPGLSDDPKSSRSREPRRQEKKTPMLGGPPELLHFVVDRQELAD